MLVKKINPEWQPSENPGLAVGETLEVTDAKALIIQKLVVAIGENGEELDAFDLYGVVDQDLVQQLKDMKAAKRKQAENDGLVEENKKLEAELAAAKKAAEEADKNKKDTSGLGDLGWKELQAKAKKAGIFKVGMTRAEVEKELEKIND